MDVAKLVTLARRAGDKNCTCHDDKDGAKEAAVELLKSLSLEEWFNFLAKYAAIDRADAKAQLNDMQHYAREWMRFAERGFEGGTPCFSYQRIIDILTEMTSEV